ncbi:MAG: ROK family protein [Candidatus Omnitrophica bacterium]|nr:Glucokinase [bacterium]NUN95473.1 ROK family protein [Candidatus Omnitrophota bacterium]
MPPKFRGCSLGIDVGGTKIYSLILDENNVILGRGKKKTGDGSPESLLGRMMASVGQALDEAGVDRKNLRCAGIGFPGPLDPKTGIILQATNLPAWNQFPLADEASQFLGCPVFIDNDVNLGTFGEAVLGAGKGSDNVVGMFLGTGVGGGIILNGHIYHGTTGTAGELGHVIIQHGGPPGPFNLRGSVEGLTSRTAIVNRIKKEIKKGKKCALEELLKSGKRIRSSDLADAYHAGDSVVRKTFEQTAEFVGVTIGSLINLLAPDVVVLGGGVMEAMPEAIYPTAKRVAMEIALESNRNHSRIEVASLGDDAGALGGALYARQRLIENGGR